MKNLSIFIFVLSIFVLISCSNEKKGPTANPEEVKKMEQQLQILIDNFVKEYQPVEAEANLAYWNAANYSNDSNWAKFSKYDMEMNKILSNPKVFGELKKIKESGLVQDSMLQQEMINLYDAMLGKQADTTLLNEISTLTSQIEQKFSNFRTKYNGKELSDNDVENVLKTSTNLAELEGVWTEQKKIGPVVADDILKLVKLRNKLAKSLGFNNFYEMSLTLSGQDPKEISTLFDELDNLTSGTFTSLKKEMDSVLASRLKIKSADLMPWHYQNRFFQEAPKIYSVDLDKYYKNKDIVKLTEEYYQSLNMPIDKIVAHSDLFERKNKNQHAFCIDINRITKDIRVLCNIKPNEDWMGTMLHENGHALYEEYLSDNLPWILKQPAHIFTTEAVALFFQRLSTNPQWMQDMKIIDAKENEKITPISVKILQLKELVFSRWAQVMYRFEKALYENPDQDLNKLWWDLVEKYQMIKRPANRNMPDWATKIHIATSPCYYHNYLLGELFASQMYYYLADKVVGTPDAMNLSFFGNTKVGDFFKDKIFSVGAKYQWNDMIQRATGEKLTAKYFAKQFINSKK
jgi:peptidyl-dipeptidase A